MQIQSNLFAPSTTKAPGGSSSNVKSSRQVEPSHQVEQSQKSQGLEASQQVTHGQTDNENSQQHALSAPPQNPSPEELESRLGAKLEYEQQTQGTEGAVAHYLANQHAAQREAIQQMVGIDTYA